MKRSGAAVARQIASRVFPLLFGIGLSWLLLEVGLRVAFDALPPAIQGDIQNVRRLPWSEETILPQQQFIIDRDFQVRMPVGLRGFPVRWSDAQFTYDTISAWDGHRAGLRSDPPEWPLDIVTFGDSFTWCWAAWSDCWNARLRSDHGWRLFNAAIPGTGPYGQFNLMKELVPPLKPKLVVWLWFPNDMSDDYDLSKIRGEVGDLSKGPYPDPEPALTGVKSISAVWKIIDARLNPPQRTSRYQHYQHLTLNGREMSIHTDEYPHPYALVYGDTQFGLDHNLKTHREAATFLQAEGVKLLIVLLPVKEEAYRDQIVATLGAGYAPYLEAVGEGRRKLLAQCAALAVTCVDALPALQAAVNAGQTVFYAFDSHLDKVGNELLAAIVADAITANQLLPAATN